jgi:hypothetical protein
MLNGIFSAYSPQSTRLAMVNDDVVKCPLCGGFTHIENPVLVEALKNPRLREQVEKYVTELLKSPVEELSTVGAAQSGSDFQKEVHTWNPCVPMWRRSPKE